MDNALSTLWFERGKDSPAKDWWNAEPWHPAIGRALRIDRAEFGGVYALAPFRVIRIEGKPMIAAAWPAPRILGPVDYDWLDIEAVIAWNPVDDTAFVMGDPVPQLVGKLSDDAPQIHASPRAFFQQWAIRRAAYAMQASQAAQQSWHIKPTERDEVPGVLMTGPIEKIRWNPAAMPEHIECVGCDPQHINRAILRAARLPRAVSASQRIAA